MTHLGGMREGWGAGGFWVMVTFGWKVQTHRRAPEFPSVCDGS